MGQIKALIGDPHGRHLDDAVTKLKALADFAEKYGDSFHRIEAISGFLLWGHRLRLRPEDAPTTTSSRLRRSDKPHHCGYRTFAALHTFRTSHIRHFERSGFGSYSRRLRLSTVAITIASAFAIAELSTLTSCR